VTLTQRLFFLIKYERKCSVNTPSVIQKLVSTHRSSNNHSTGVRSPSPINREAREEKGRTREEFFLSLPKIFQLFPL
jgi:hypothetical protein